MTSSTSRGPPPPLRNRQRLPTRNRFVIQTETDNANGDLVEDIKRRSSIKHDPNHRTLNKMPLEANAISIKATITCKYGDLFKLVDTAGWYEDIKPPDFVGMCLILRLFPFGKDQSDAKIEDQNSVLGVWLLNPCGFLNDYVKKQTLKVLVRVKQAQTSFTIVLGNFGLPNGAIQYATLNLMHSDWKNSDKCTFELVYKQNPMMPSKRSIFHPRRGLDYYQMVLDLGTVHIYSSDEDEYVVGNDFILRAVDEEHHKHVANKENVNKNENKNNKHEAETDGDEDYLSLEYVRCEMTLLCAFSVIFKNEVTGMFKTSQHFSINLSIQQIKCVIFYMCQREIPNLADPCTMAALGNYLNCDDMMDEALKLCLAELDIDNFLRTAKLFQYLKVGKDQGLITLADWIKKQKEEGNIDLNAYAAFKQSCPYVENMIDFTKSSSSPPL